jgi:hypothetical protein
LGNYRRSDAAHKLKGVTVFVRKRPGIERLQTIEVNRWIILSKVISGMRDGFSRRRMQPMGRENGSTGSSRLHGPILTREIPYQDDCQNHQYSGTPRLFS